MSAYGKTFSSNFGSIKVGQIEDWWYLGNKYGYVYSFDSQYSSVMNLQGAYIAAQDKAAVSVDTFEDINGAGQAVASWKTDISEFLNAQEIIDRNAVWLWGGWTEGGAFLLYDKNPYATYTVAFYACNGVYSQIVNEVQYYRFNIFGGMENRRTYQDLASCILAYDASGNIYFICCKGSAIPVYVYEAGTVNNYVAAAAVNDLSGFTATRQKMVSPVPPLITHATVYDLTDSNVISRLDAIFNDEIRDIPDQIHISGTWFGGQGLPQHQPTDEGGGDTTYEDPEYVRYSDDPGKTTKKQFEKDAINSGLVTIFNPTQQEILEFCDFLFSGITENIAAFFKRLMSNPLDYVISLNMCHLKPVVGDTAEIKFGGIGSGVVSYMIPEQFQLVPFGSVEIPEQYNGYWDMAGYTKIKINLPYCGKHEIDVDLTMGSTITLNYWVDYLSGACIAQVLVGRGVRHDNDTELVEGMRYEFTGNVFEQVPLSASDYRAAIQGILTAVAGAGSIAAGNPVSGASAIASGVMAMKPHIETTGKVGSSFGYMGDQKAYIEIYRPNPAQPDQFGMQEGLASCAWVQLDKMDGFTVIAKDGIRLTDINYITDEEITELTNILESGVYL